jgi:hypothetical protein
MTAWFTEEVGAVGIVPFCQSKVSSGANNVIPEANCTRWAGGGLGLKGEGRGASADVFSGVI